MPFVKTFDFVYFDYYWNIEPVPSKEIKFKYHFWTKIKFLLFKFILNEFILITYHYFSIRQWSDGKKLREMKLSMNKNDVVRKRKDMFEVLKEEGLKREENKDVTEEEVDRLWNDERWKYLDKEEFQF